jgi:hypothetical protein
MAPCFNGPSRAWGWWWDDSDWIHPELIDGNWVNITCGVCLSDCACSHVSEIVLPGPVWGILSVVDNGVDLVEGVNFRLDDRRKLVRTDGGEWPTCQDWGVSEGPGTLIVTARFGKPVPSLGLMAVSELASELVAACTPGIECHLPRRVTELIRNGLTITLDDTNFLFDKSGAIGLPTSDLFLSTYNPNGRRRRARVYSPDRPRPRVATTNPVTPGPFDVIDGGDL